MRFLFAICLILLLIGCDGGDRPSPTINRPSITQPTLRPEPPLDEAIQTLLTPRVTAQFERDFNPRLSTPAALFDEPESTAEPTINNEQPTQTAVPLLLGTAIPTRAPFATSTPIARPTTGFTP